MAFNNATELSSVVDTVHEHAPGVERLDLPLATLRVAPFFTQFDALLRQQLAFHCPRDPGMSYAIWGGVAVNLVLQALDLTKVFYSIHDIEMFFVRGGVLHEHERLSAILGPVLASDSRFLLKLGGLKIVRDHPPSTFDAFQMTRTHMPDGDLCLNNLALWIDRQGARAIVTSPTGTFKSLLVGALNLKPCTTLTPERLARRISRTVAKAIRLEQVASLRLTESARAQLRSLIETFAHNTKSDTLAAVGNSKATSEPLTKKVVERSIRLKQLYISTIAETAKRIFPLSNAGDLTEQGLARLLFARGSHGEALLAHPLIALLLQWMPDQSWALQPRVKNNILRRCYTATALYHQADAVHLIDNYRRQ